MCTRTKLFDGDMANVHPAILGAAILVYEPEIVGACAFGRVEGEEQGLPPYLK